MPTDRERIEIRKWQAEVAAFEAAEREKAEAPIRAAEAELAETYRKMRSLARDAALSEHGDFGWKTPEGLAGLSLDWNLAEAINVDCFKEFLAQNQKFATEYDCSEARTLLCDYLERQGCQIANVEAYETAFQRLVEAGILRPKPKPQPAPPVVREEAEEFLPEPEPEPEFLIGRDLETGQEKTFTRYQVNRMGADMYRRVFGIPQESRNHP